MADQIHQFEGPHPEPLRPHGSVNVFDGWQSLPRGCEGPRCRTAAQREFTMNPGVSLASGGRFAPSRQLHMAMFGQARLGFGAQESPPQAPSMRRGLKKCNPLTCSGRWHPLRQSRHGQRRGVRRQHRLSLPTMCSRRWNRSVLMRRSSTMASITSSADARASKDVVLTDAAFDLARFHLSQSALLHQTAATTLSRLSWLLCQTRPLRRRPARREQPAWAAIWAKPPLPMVPAPTIPT